MFLRFTAIWEAFRVATGSLRTNKLRTALTLMGIVVGWLISTIVHLAVPSIPSSVPMWAVVTGMGVSVAVGLVFGLWPAWKAARLDPIEALRYE